MKPPCQVHKCVQKEGTRSSNYGLRHTKVKTCQEILIIVLYVYARYIFYMLLFCFYFKFFLDFFFFIYKFIYFNQRLITLQYCIAFAIHQHESATGIHVFPLLNTPPSSLPIPSLRVIPVHQPQGSCIEPGLAIHFLYDIIHVSMPFPQIIPLSPSLTESKRLFYTSVSLLLSRIQGYHYHLSKFHIYVLVFCIGVFLSALLHSV